MLDLDFLPPPPGRDLMALPREGERERRVEGVAESSSIFLLLGAGFFVA